MKNKQELRDVFFDMAEEIYGAAKAHEMMVDLEEILGGVEVFELMGFSGVGYMVYREGDQGWTWKSYELGEPDIFWGNYGTRAEALISAAVDADMYVYDYVDSTIGDRIRAAI